MAKITTKLKCPKCGLGTDAEIKAQKHRFLIFKCPCCGSNVVLYSDKVKVLSDSLVRELFMYNKIKFCGEFVSQVVQSDRPPISTDDVNNLRILLATEDSVDKVIASL